MRKQRRRIKRRKIKKSKIKKRSILSRHLNCAPTNYWTKMTTYTLITFEFVFVLWWLQDLLLNWTEILIKLQNIINIAIG